MSVDRSLPHVVASPHAQGLVLLHVGQGRLFATNHVGARIWAGLERQHTIDVIVDDLCQRFGVGADVVRADAEQFLHDLTKYDLAGGVR